MHDRIPGELKVDAGEQELSQCVGGDVSGEGRSDAGMHPGGEREVLVVVPVEPESVCVRVAVRIAVG